MNLAALRKKQQEQANAPESVPHNAANGATPASSPSPSATVGKSQSESVAPAKAPASDAAKNGSAGRLRFGTKRAGTPTDSGPDKPSGPAPTSALAKRFGSRPEQPSDSSDSNAGTHPAPEPERADDVIGNLADLSESEAGSKPALAERAKLATKFDDEVPADAPPRVLDDLNEQQLAFVALLDGVYKVTHEPEFLGDVVSNIMVELQKNQEYRKLVQPKDIRTMIQGMRASMGMARIKKQEKSRKAGPGRGAKSSKALDTDILSSLDELGLSDLGG